ncbi:[histone H3]-lysine(4) N-trimethyltransferase [Malassezia caprae]|uniref:[histone H3]-lysine(4) N-trimethyltransferase n=1 Tax=Malassezia caprae TaxID=1381934 RepID=A0AAF0IYK7_9BASI|nr:[histone H3]-lysine(4) N-trimethyltransferase [Malassezia caprae]
MEELPADDDLLSCMLVDSLEFDPGLVTHKMNPAFRPMRFDREAMAQLVRQHIIWERDLSKAWAAFCSFPVVRKHMAGKTPAQDQVFETHALRYMRAYLPEAGFEYVVTHRYRTARLRRLRARDASDMSPLPAHLAPGRTDLCVVALREFQPNELITYCTAALKDLSAAEDEALREEAASARAADVRDGRVRPQRDFSIIRSSSRKCSQLLLGPARFINHDCEPNAEFRRSGHQLSIRCIRPIKRNEEITTYYGDNYFEWGNRECMCATCERLQRGFFAQDTDPAACAMPDPETPSDDSSRTLRSHTAHAMREQTSIPLSTDLISYQLDPEALGPECECLTCHAPFRAPEKWWVPDECGRCERHYKLYKRDWPGRHPKENPAEQTTTARSLKRRASASTAPPKRPRKRAEANEAETLAHSSPVKLSPVHEVPGASRESSPASAPTRHTSRHRRFEVHSDDSDDAWDESHLGPKILGHGASTDVLASYWGAPEGERRTRRPTHHGTTVLSERAPPSRQPVTQRRKPSREAHRPTQDELKRTSRRSASHPAPLPEADTAQHSVSDTSEHRRADTLKIATTGPERTSLSNLALFWSGGVEGRTRQQARQGRGAPEPSRAAPPRARRHGPNGRASPAKAEAPPAVDASRAPGTPAVQPKAESEAAEDVARASDAPRTPSVDIKREPASLGSASPDVLKSEPAGPGPVPRPVTPLPTALPPGVPPRQPLRRNLRWGSGKTSSSRPASVPVQPVRTAWTPLQPERALAGSGGAAHGSPRNDTP